MKNVDCQDITPIFYSKTIIRNCGLCFKILIVSGVDDIMGIQLRFIGLLAWKMIGVNKRCNVLTIDKNYDKKEERTYQIGTNSEYEWNE